MVNGSFESLTALPTTTGQWNLVPGWLGTGSSENTPDVFHVRGAGGGDLPRLGCPCRPIKAWPLRASWRRVPPGPTDANTSLEPFPAAPNRAAYRFTFRMTNGERTTFHKRASGVSKLGMHFSMGPLQQMGTAPLA